MWIRMRTTAAGPELNPALEAGSVVQVADRLGRSLVEAGAAEEVAWPPAPPVETAALKPEGETAVEEQPAAADETGEGTLIDKLRGRGRRGASGE